MDKQRINLAVQVSGATGGPSPVSVLVDPGALVGQAGVSQVAVAPRSWRLWRGPGRTPALLDVRPAAEHLVELSWLEGVDSHTDLVLEADLEPLGDPSLTLSAAAFPRVQWLPEPDRRLDATIDGRVVATYHYDPTDGKPFCHPLLGPAGVPLTRMGHPADAEGRTHQHGLWVAYRDLAGENFWDDRAGSGRQRHRAIERLDDGALSATLVAGLTWEAADGALLAERRTLRLWSLPADELALDVTLSLRAAGRAVKFGRTPYGLLGLRVNRTMSVLHGGGQICLATGDLDETEALHRRARWCDYSGPVAPAVWNGIAIFDHDSNPHHPCAWQVRDDGWMGPAPFYDSETLLPAGGAVEFRYRLRTHAGNAETAGLADSYEAWVDPPRVTLGGARLAVD